MCGVGIADIRKAGGAGFLETGRSAILKRFDGVAIDANNK
jgi:hypothetical protein